MKLRMFQDLYFYKSQRQKYDKMKYAINLITAFIVSSVTGYGFKNYLLSYSCNVALQKDLPLKAYSRV